jgi:RNA polymerase sigma factor (sigma-70 family)
MGLYLFVRRDAIIHTVMSFPDTRHSAIVGLHDKDQVVRRQSYAVIIGAYWHPVRKYVRLRWHENTEDGSDLAQAFFSNALESGALAGYDPARGSFRTYLRTCLDHFIINTRKRNARNQALPLDFDVAALDESQDEVFQREWVRNLFSLAVEDLRAGSDHLRFGVFEAYDLNESGTRPTYSELATKFGTTTERITNYLAAMRRDFRKAVLNRLRELTANEREFRSEARAILGVEV